MNTQSAGWRTVLVLGCAQALAAPVAAQSPSWDGMRSAGISVAAMKPNLADDEFSFATGAVLVSGKVRVGQSTLLVADLPFARGGISHSDGDRESSTTLGSPYLGIDVQTASGWSWAVGGRIPLQHEFGADDYATGIGFIGDSDRMDAYLSKVLVLSGSARYDGRSARGFTVRLQAGPILDTPFGDDADLEDAEMFVAYAATFGYTGSPLELSAGIVGRAVLSESDLQAGRRSIDYLVGEVALGSARVQPVFGGRVPLDADLREGLSSVVSVGLRIR
jgi:hypothetical protein